MPSVSFEFPYVCGQSFASSDVGNLPQVKATCFDVLGRVWLSGYSLNMRLRITTDFEMPSIPTLRAADRSYPTSSPTPPVTGRGVSKVWGIGRVCHCIVSTGTGTSADSAADRLNTHSCVGLGGFPRCMVLSHPRCLPPEPEISSSCPYYPRPASHGRESAWKPRSNHGRRGQGPRRHVDA